MLKDCAVPTVPLWTVAILPADRKMFCVVSHFTRFVPCELVPLAISFSAEHHIRTQPNLSKQRKSARKGAASRSGSTTSPHGIITPSQSFVAVPPQSLQSGHRRPRGSPQMRKEGMHWKVCMMAAPGLGVEEGYCTVWGVSQTQSTSEEVV